MVCFGRIKRHPKHMLMVLEGIAGMDNMAGAVIGQPGTTDTDLLDALERIMVTAKTEEGSNVCGPMFWSFRRALYRATEAEV